MTYRASRYHDFSAGHRVAGHEHKCRHLHGHNYRVHFHCEAKLDSLGRVIDFGVIKSKLCMWLEEYWDHKMLIWCGDDIVYGMLAGVEHNCPASFRTLNKSVVWVSFNPTAENMARYLVEEIGPKQLSGTGVVLVEVVVEETRKCSASYRRES